MKFQKQFILDVYDNPHVISRASLSTARKDDKSLLIAAVLLAYLGGAEAKQKSQIISGARSSDQARSVFKFSEKMISLSRELSKSVRIVVSQKTRSGLVCNVEYKDISASSEIAHSSQAASDGDRE